MTGASISTPATTRQVDSPENDTLHDGLYRRITWRIMPVLLLAYIVAYIDRVNVGFAKLQMQDALGFSDAAFGLGAGLMFVGYCLFEVPSNLLLARIGVRKTFLRIMVLWGLTTVAMMFVTTTAQFYTARFLLGVFEAGLFPGVILYITYWFPKHRRGRVIGVFMSGALIGNVLAGPLSGAAMKFLDGTSGLAGWQWLYITQGVPAIILGFVAYAWLCDGPRQATWLSDDEKTAVENQAGRAPEGHMPKLGQVLEALRERQFRGFVLLNFFIVGASYTMVFWVPTLIKSWGVADVFTIGLLSALPSLVGVVGVIVLSRHSDRKQERRWHFCGACVVAAVGLWLTTITQGQLVPSLAALCFATLGLASCLPILLASATDQMTPGRTTVDIPLLTSLGILGGFASPAITGLINTRTGHPVYSMHLVIGLLLVSATLMLFVVPRRQILDTSTP